ncbi:MAG: bifunctional UDP-N-acetylglucosamine diphosphorylase/glucosamine-1-phosphate N-acetyltransferase GlmU, partial [Alphaproteobacteria bacterium]
MAENELTAVILAAGMGTRMKSAVPKVLHPIAGRPMIHYVLASLEPLGSSRTVVVTGPDMEDVADAVAPAETVVQSERLGTADAVKAAREALAGVTGPVLVLYGDTPLISSQTLAAMVDELASAPGRAVVVLGFRPEEPGEYGRLVTGSDGQLEAIVEAREATASQRRIGLCNSGVMAIDGAHLFDLLDKIGDENAKSEFYLTDIVGIARLMGLGCGYIEAAESELLGINSRADLAVAEAVVQWHLRDAAMAGGVTLTDPETVFFSYDTRLGRDVTVGPNVVFGPGVVVDDGVEIRSYCHIEGAEIGTDAVIGPFARLRPGTRIAPRVHIGNFVEIKNALFEEGAKANHLSYIGDTNVGAEANIGAGTITCNYDGFLKNRTEIGARAFIGSNAALVAPVKIGEGAIVGAGSVIARDVDADALAVTRA